MTVKALTIALATFAASSVFAASAIASDTTTTHYGSARALSFEDATPQASIRGKTIIERAVTNNGSASKLRFEGVVADAGGVDDGKTVHAVTEHSNSGISPLLRRNYDWR
ncbi:MAG: hypothetical protein KI792_12805 [Alphaproteobacteria bacterium]|nr:hypothetical protein [Alphaproteobacteria bacterium SS10]